MKVRGGGHHRQYGFSEIQRIMMLPMLLLLMIMMVTTGKSEAVPRHLILGSSGGKRSKNELRVISADCTTSVVTGSVRSPLFQTFLGFSHPCPLFSDSFWGLLILAGCHTHPSCVWGRAPRQPQDPR